MGRKDGDCAGFATPRGLRVRKSPFAFPSAAVSSRIPIGAGKNARLCRGRSRCGRHHSVRTRGPPGPRARAPLSVAFESFPRGRLSRAECSPRARSGSRAPASFARMSRSEKNGGGCAVARRRRHAPSVVDARALHPPSVRLQIIPQILFAPTASHMAARVSPDERVSATPVRRDEILAAVAAATARVRASTRRAPPGRLPGQRRRFRGVDARRHRRGRPRARLLPRTHRRRRRVSLRLPGRARQVFSRARGTRQPPRARETHTTRRPRRDGRPGPPPHHHTRLRHARPSRLATHVRRRARFRSRRTRRRRRRRPIPRHGARHRAAPDAIPEIRRRASPRGVRRGGASSRREDDRRARPRGDAPDGNTRRARGVGPRVPKPRPGRGPRRRRGRESRRRDAFVRPNRRAKTDTRTRRRREKGQKGQARRAR